VTRDCLYIDDNICKWREKSLICQSLESKNICRDKDNYCYDMNVFLELCKDEDSRLCKNINIESNFCIKEENYFCFDLKKHFQSAIKDFMYCKNVSNNNRCHKINLIDNDYCVDKGYYECVQVNDLMYIPNKPIYKRKEKNTFYCFLCSE
jgi:hypothetical protein